MKRVITYGTFDLLHYGHINLLKRAKALGDYLIVVLSTDEFNWNEKQKKCYFSYEQRKALLESIRYVDLVIPRGGKGLIDLVNFQNVTIGAKKQTEKVKQVRKKIGATEEKIKTDKKVIKKDINKNSSKKGSKKDD